MNDFKIENSNEGYFFYLEEEGFNIFMGRKILFLSF